MSEIFESTLIIPIIFYLIVFSIIQFPLEFYRMYYISNSYLDMHIDQKHIYKIKDKNNQKLIEVNPQYLLELVHSVDDAYQELIERNGINNE
ncbi:hypothetical protein [Fastidiosipila sanguinis]|uniref:Uncharacterized protein n=1 Tax=Fastidiosipila sanguinis TaxID=236753 RepID=A0A2S0KMN8_9FIRM|nr:hypothetical protein [Fastidiosipila sanguinis]AVM42277.1 hypothetical protein C5Q98_03095 [Fastidiosipila sanguinis]